MALVTIAESLNENGQAALQSTPATERKGQSFTSDISGLITEVTLNIASTAGEGNLLLEVYLEDGNDEPTGAVLASSTVLNSLVPQTVRADYAFSFLQEVELVKDTKYVLVLSRDAGTILVGTSNLASYLPGKYIQSSDGGATWSKPLNSDMYFGVYGNDAVPGGQCKCSFANDETSFETWGW